MFHVFKQQLTLKITQVAILDGELRMIVTTDEGELLFEDEMDPDILQMMDGSTFGRFEAVTNGRTIIVTRKISLIDVVASL